MRLSRLEGRARGRDYARPLRIEGWGGRPRDGECGHLVVSLPVKSSPRLWSTNGD